MEYHESYYSGSSSSYTINLQPRLPSLNSQRNHASIPSLNNNNTQSHSHHHHHHHCLATLKGHTSYISSLTLADKILITGSSDSEIKSWNRYYNYNYDEFNPGNELENSSSCSCSSTLINTVLAGKGAVKSLVFQSDTLFSAHQDHKIRVWKITTNNTEPEQHHKYTRLATLPTFGDRASKVLIPKNHVRIRRHKKCTWVHHVDAVSALALSKDGTLLYSVSWDRTIKIWRTRDFACLESVNNAHDDAINAVEVSHDGCVYTGSADKSIKVWAKVVVGQGENKKHSLVETLEKHNSGINALALRSDGTVLYSGACDRLILVWEKGKGDDDGKMVVVGALRGHTKSILCLCVVSDLVCSGSADKTIRIWRGFGREYCCLGVLQGHLGPIKCLTAAVDHCNSSSESEASFLLYSGSLDCDVKVWQIFVPAV